METYSCEYTSPTLGGHYYKLILELSPIGALIEDNITTLDWEFKYYDSGAHFTGNIPLGYTIRIDGKIIHSGSFTASSTGTVTLASGTVDIPHNYDGRKNLRFGFNTDWEELYASGNVDLAPIPRSVVITDAPNFNDEENPTIRYENLSGELIDKLEACISFTGAKDDVPYREIPKGEDDSSYTFNLTTEERRILRKGITSGNSSSVRFYVRTTIQGETYLSSVTKTLSLINYQPTLSPTAVDSNARTVALTGNNKKFIRYYSNASFNTGSQARKEATITSQYATCGGETITAKTGVFEAVTSNTIYYGATDSRGYSANGFTTHELIPYVKLTSSLELGMLSANGELEFTIRGKYFDGSFGAKSNSMEVEYTAVDSKGNFVFATSGESSGWVRLGTVTPSVEGNDYTFTHKITGLNYVETYTITVNVIDALTPVQTVSSVAAATPIYDWGGNDFAHHTVVYMDNSKGIYGTTADGTKIDALNPCNSSNSLVVGWGGYNNNIGKTDLMGKKIYITSREGVVINNSTLADFVVEQASNGTWFYRKWNSGRVELSGYQNVNSLPCDVALGGWFRTAVQYPPNFPITVNNPKMVANYTSSGYGALLWFTTYPTSSKPADYYLIRPTTSAGISGIVTFYVTGTWK